MNAAHKKKIAEQATTSSDPAVSAAGRANEAAVRKATGPRDQSLPHGPIRIDEAPSLGFSCLDLRDHVLVALLLRRHLHEEAFFQVGEFAVIAVAGDLG